MRALRRAHGDVQLPFVFAEMADAVRSTLNVQKPIPRRLKLMNLKDAGTIRVCHVTLVSSMMQDMSITFGAPCK